MRWGLLIVLLLVSQVAYSWPLLDTFYLKGANDRPVMPYYRYWPDTAGEARPWVAFSQLMAGNFQKVSNKNVFNSRYTRSSYWFALGIKNDTSVALPMLWSFYNNNICVQLYDASGLGNPVLLDSLCSTRSLNARAFPARSLSTRLVLPAKGFRLLLARVSMINCDAVYFPSDITTPDDFLIWETHYELLAGMYIGYFVFTCLINIFLWGILRHRIHLWHACSIFMLIGYSLSENMMDVMLLPDCVYAVFIKLPRILFLCLALFFSITVFQLFTRQKKSMPVFYRITTLIKWTLLIAGGALFVFSLVLPPQTNMLRVLRIGCDVLFVVGLIALLLSVFAGVAKRQRLFVLYLIALFAVLLAYVDYISVNEFGYQLFYFRPGNILIGLSIEIFVLTIFFIYSQQQERKAAYVQLKEAELMKTNAATRLIAALENERRRIARDLHDGLGASVSSLRFFMSNYFKKQQPSRDDETAFRNGFAAQVNAINDEARKIAHNLMPADFEALGLSELLRRHIQVLNEHTSIQFTLHIEDLAPALTKEKEFFLYRIFLELLENIVRHAHATSAMLLYETRDESHFFCRITDNGTGFSINSTPGIGIKSVRSRVEYLGGSLQITSGKNGTAITILIPA